MCGEMWNVFQGRNETGNDILRMISLKARISSLKGPFGKPVITMKRVWRWEKWGLTLQRPSTLQQNGKGVATEAEVMPTHHSFLSFKIIACYPKKDSYCCERICWISPHTCIIKEEKIPNAEEDVKKLGPLYTAGGYV